MYQDQELIIRPIAATDVRRLWELVYEEEAPEWKKGDGAVKRGVGRRDEAVR